MNILMVAAENDALEGGKVGGIGDVIRDIAPALADHGCGVTVVTPSHGFLHTLPGAVSRESFPFSFRGYAHRGDIFEVQGSPPHSGVRHLVLHHPSLGVWNPATRSHTIYVHDGPDTPFKTDASRFALFGAAVAAAASRGLLGEPDVIHLHDWHGAAVLILREFDPEYAGLKNIRTVFTVHNLALQGIRPLRGDDSSLEAWFPALNYDWLSVSDPRWPDCVNLMAAGIRLADTVHTVSPAYAREILLPSGKPRYYGGEGLEPALRYVHDSGRLVGILNGCAYPPDRPPPGKDFSGLPDLFGSALIGWSGRRDRVSSAQFIAYARLGELSRRHVPPPMLLTSVSRVADQKMYLLRENGGKGKSGLERILEGLGDRGCYFLLGTGDTDYERFFVEMSSRHRNFVFLNGYSDACARALYANGDLFLMPSSYEPCGISQMLAMRDGQPCVVHAVGGLKDTVADPGLGFPFTGESVADQVDGLVETTLSAVALKEESPGEWERIRRRAAAARFTWDDTARQYLERLYGDSQQPAGAVI